MPAPGEAFRSQRLQDVSSRALLFAAALIRSMEAGSAASFLYAANSVPLTPDWLRRTPDENAVLKRLTFEDATRGRLESGWTMTREPHWFYWRPRKAVTGKAARFKLYVSAMPEDAGEAMAAAVAVFAAFGAPVFKVARSPRAFLRPDRMVAYFRSRDEIGAVAQAMSGRLDGLAVQGVPFTPSAHPTGILSWGCDPGDARRPFAASWRQVLSRKLASYLYAADAQDPQERVKFALRRIANDDVEPSTWEPGPSFWSSAVE